MKTYATFFDAGWDFIGNGANSTWGIDESPANPANNGYPFLAWEGFDHKVRPAVTTGGADNITAIKADVQGEITCLGYPHAAQHGVCWSTQEGPTVDDAKTQEGEVLAAGAFTSSLTGLEEETTYYAKAYVINELGTYYGGQVQFATLAPVTVYTEAIPGITPPAAGQAPVTSITDTDQYSGSVSWNPDHDPFLNATVYTATITLTPKDGYTLTGVAEDFFTVAGATTVSNDADSGVVTAVFPATAAPAGGGGGRTPTPPPVKDEMETSKEISAAAGGTVSLGGVSVNIPAGVLPNNAAFSIKKMNPGEANNLVPEGLRLKLGSDVYEIATTGGRDFGENTITINVPFDPEKMADGEVPVINYYDEETGEWTAVETTVEQGADGKWYAVIEVNHLTRFAVFSTAVLEPAQPPKVIRLTIGSAETSVDGEPYILDAAPFIKPEASRTLVPLRFVSEALGAQVEWRADTRQVIIRDGETGTILTIGSQEALVNSAPVTLDCPAELLPPGRTFVPVRFISEILGARVEWDQETRGVTIIR